MLLVLCSTFRLLIQPQSSIIFEVKGALNSKEPHGVWVKNIGLYLSSVEGLFGEANDLHLPHYSLPGFISSHIPVLHDKSSLAILRKFRTSRIHPAWTQLEEILDYQQDLLHRRLQSRILRRKGCRHHKLDPHVVDSPVTQVENS